MSHFIMTPVLLLMFNLGLSKIPHFHNRSISSKTPERTNISDLAKVEARLKKVSSKTWQIEVSITNNGNAPILIMTNPRCSDGKDGYYLSLDRKNPSLLEVKAVFEDISKSGVKLWKDEAGVELQQLIPHKSFTVNFEIILPTNETTPPYRRVKEMLKIDPEKIKSVRVSIGVLPHDDGILDLLERKFRKSFVNGYEAVIKGEYKDKRLYQLQTIIKSEEIPFM